jgi:hypothetical protein
MRLNQKNFAPLLANILGVPAQYVVPMQGNWYKPTGAENNPAKPLTWCGFKFESHRGVTLAHFIPDTATPPNNWSVQEKLSKLVLQFVGDIAEDLANDVGHWTHNQLVISALAQFDGGIMGASDGAVSSVFDQEGGNTVLAWNAWALIGWADEVNSGQGRWPSGGVKFLPGPLVVS